VGLERGPLSLVMIIVELLEWKSSGSGQNSRINDRGDPLCWPHDTLYPQKLALTSPTSGGRSVDIVRLRTKGHGVLVIYVRNFERHMQIANRCAPWKIASGAENVPFPYSLITSCHGPHRKRVRLPVHWSDTSAGRGPDDSENTATSIVA
jgi:hypothetical protein